MQGVRGPKPTFFTGNILDMASLVSKATSQDMKTISHDIVGRLLPHFLLWSSQFGMYVHNYKHIYVCIYVNIILIKLILYDLGYLFPSNSIGRVR